MRISTRQRDISFFEIQTTELHLQDLAVNLDESKTATEQKLAETPAPTILAQNLTTTI